MKRFLLITVFLSSVISVEAQEEKNFPALIKNDIPEGIITRESYYGGDGLWGLINGGADIYLEYGFGKLLLQEIELWGIKFRVEFYRMIDTKAAFGIFSVSRYKCTLNDTLTKHICITPYQVQAAVEKFYISIANDSGTKEAQNLTTELLKNVLTRIKEIEFELPTLFRQKIFDSYKNQMKFFRGALGLQNGFPAWIEIFANYSNYEIYLLPIESDNGYAYISQIKFESEKEAQRFISENREEKQSKILKRIKLLSADEIIFIESNLPEDELKKYTVSIDDK